MFTEKLAEHIRTTYFPTLEAFDDNTFRYVRLAYWIYSGKQQRHNFDRNYYFVSHKARRKWWGDKQRTVFDLLNIQHGYFEVQNVALARKHHKLFRLSPTGKEVFDEATSATRNGNTEWLNESGNKIWQPLPVLHSRDSKGSHAVRPEKCEINWLLAVNTDALFVAEQLLNVALALPHEDTSAIAAENRDPVVEMYLATRQEHGAEWLEVAATLKQQINSILAAVCNDRFGKGLYPQSYKQSTSGRWVCTGGTGLQNQRRFVREAALLGYYKYDISNCQLVLLDQLAGDVKVTGALGGYLDGGAEHKKWIREIYGEAVGLTAEESKQAIMRRAFGANINSPSMVRALKGRHRDFWSCPWIADVYKDIGTIRTAAIKNARRSKRGRILNALNKECPPGKNKNQIAAHLAQGAEAACLNAVIESPWAGDLSMLLHDGWYSASEMPIEELQDWIFEKTQFRVEITCET